MMNGWMNDVMGLCAACFVLADVTTGNPISLVPGTIGRMVWV